MTMLTDAGGHQGYGAPPQADFGFILATAMRLLVVSCAISSVIPAAAFIANTISPAINPNRINAFAKATAESRAVHQARAYSNRASHADVTMAAAVIVGGGRIGSALHDMGGGKDTLVGRTDDIPDIDGPIYVCTRNDDLADVIQRTPAHRRENLVFVQNGVLGPMLGTHGLAKNTQALIYFAVSKKGEAPIDGITDTNPEGLTSTCGKWAEELKGRLASGGLTCHVLSESSYTARMYEKHIWICAFMLSGAVHKCNVGEVEATHTEEVRALISEMQAAIESEYGVTFEAGVPERLCAYARSVAHFPTAVKEFGWRNEFFWAISEKARKDGKEDPCPLHSKFLKQVADEQGLAL